ncbi:2-hydroxyisoflavanone dehydratase-like [Sesamum indicum]|uniref:2-hydroxyisoflavanone dehydratase-like n=1 Tax=Sesamum indicum TaxID=4182 RepID=A0A6I9SY69_SESIN|nr:2-hydroxyisoflavanone dehydratase-like [Sesamum indicum]
MVSPTKIEVLTDLSPFIKVYTERLLGTPHVPPSPEDPTTGVASKDTTITPNVSARLYLPKLSNPTQKLPILVYYHGGGFCVDSAFSCQYHRYMNLLSSKSGALVVSVEYRLAPEYLLPAAYEDSWDALKWVCSHVLDHTHFEKDQWITNHADFNRVFIGGDSAGGNVTHNIAMHAGSESLPGNVKILGAVLSYPHFWGSNPIGDEPTEDMEQHIAYRLSLFVYPSAPGGIDNPSINPLADGAPSLSRLGCSKIIVKLAEKDDFTSRGLAYAEEVKSSGWKGDVEVVVVEGEGHCFHILDPETEKAKNLIKRLASFISQ